jgi:hypothetical protein
MLVSHDLEHRFVRCMPPEHRVRASRADDPEVTELIVEGPMLPEVVGDYWQRGIVHLTVIGDEEGEGVRMEGRWTIFRRDTCGVDISEPWLIGRWSCLAEMMDDIR